MLLAIDTATRWAGLALLRDGDMVHQRTWQIGQQHSVQMFDAMTHLLADAGSSIEDVAELAVTTGPGSFNGVRVGVTIARTLAYVRQVPLVGVTTLQAQAWLVRSEVAGAILSVLDAGRGEWYRQWFRADATGAVPTGAMAIRTAEALASEWQMHHVHEPLCIAGEIEAERVGSLAQIGDASTVRLFGQMLHERVRAIAFIGAELLRAGRRDDIFALEPAYVRRPNITVSARHPMAPVSDETDLPPLTIQ